MQPGFHLRLEESPIDQTTGVIVTPAKAGVQELSPKLGIEMPGFRLPPE
jgi:hypothetical protein